MGAGPFTEQVSGANGILRPIEGISRRINGLEHVHSLFVIQKSEQLLLYPYRSRGWDPPTPR